MHRGRDVRIKNTRDQDMRRIVGVALAIMLLPGCATRSVMQGIMSSWEGAHIDSVVNQWGYPDEQREFNERKLYVWHHNKSVMLPSTTTTTGTVNSYGGVNATSVTSGGGMLHGSCDRILEVDERGTVVRWEWKGNNCPFLEALEYKQWRNREPVSGPTGAAEDCASSHCGGG